MGRNLGQKKTKRRKVTILQETKKIGNAPGTLHASGKTPFRTTQRLHSIQWSCHATSWAYRHGRAWRLGPNRPPGGKDSKAVMSAVMLSDMSSVSLPVPVFSELADEEMKRPADQVSYGCKTTMTARQLAGDSWIKAKASLPFPAGGAKTTMWPSLSVTSPTKEPPR